MTIPVITPSNSKAIVVGPSADAFARSLRNAMYPSNEGKKTNSVLDHTVETM
jgi:hypothetical protein